VDHRQPAYWLSRNPAEAADFLARTAVASRVVGGFIKTAQPAPPSWTPDLSQALTHAAIGAGVGGLGGLGMGLFSKRKKNPLTSALTGALLGGTLGGTLPIAYQGLKHWADTMPATTALDKQQAEAYQKWGPWAKLHYRLNPWAAAPSISAGEPPPALQSALDRAAAEPSTVGLIGQGVAQPFGAIARGGIRAGLENPLTAAYHAGVGGLQGAYLHRTAPGQLFRDIQRGVQGIDPSLGTPAINKIKETPQPPIPAVGNPGDPGYQPQFRQDPMRDISPTPEKPSSDPGALRFKRYLTDVEPSLGETRFGIPLRGGWNPFRRLNEARLGRELQDIQAGRNTPSTGPRRVSPSVIPGVDLGGVEGIPQTTITRTGRGGGTHTTAGTVTEPAMTAADISRLGLKGQQGFAADLKAGVGPGRWGKIRGSAGRAGLYALPHLLPYVPQIWRNLTSD
jgi:hypothetical protein